VSRPRRLLCVLDDPGYFPGGRETVWKLHLSGGDNIVRLEHDLDLDALDGTAEAEFIDACSGRE